MLFEVSPGWTNSCHGASCWERSSRVGVSARPPPGKSSQGKPTHRGSSNRVFDVEAERGKTSEPSRKGNHGLRRMGSGKAGQGEIPGPRGVNHHAASAAWASDTKPARETVVVCKASYSVEHTR